MLRKLVLKLIRKANKNDVLEINKLGSKLHNNFTTNFHIETEIDSSFSIVLINEDNSKINGYLFAQDFFDNIDLLSIYVDEAERNKNIGTNLLKYLMDNYCYQDKTITLEVSEDNMIALQFYKKLGFKVVNKREKYYNDKAAFLMKWGI